MRIDSISTSDLAEQLWQQGPSVKPTSSKKGQTDPTICNIGGSRISTPCKLVSERYPMNKKFGNIKIKNKGYALETRQPIARYYPT